LSDRFCVLSEAQSRVAIDSGECSPSCLTVVPPNQFSFNASLFDNEIAGILGSAWGSVRDPLHASVGTIQEFRFDQTEWSYMDCANVELETITGGTMSWIVMPRTYRLVRVYSPAGFYSNRDHRYEFTVDFQNFPRPCGAPTAERQVAVYSVSTSFVTEQSPAATEHGVIAVYSDSPNVVKLGMFADSTPTILDNLPDSLHVSGTATSSWFVDDSDGVNELIVKESTLQDSFVGFNGDLDRNGMTCWEDRLVFGQLMGKTIGDPEYSARADFNLDGTIDAADFALFLDTDYFVDMDCDQIVDVFDLNAYLTLWFALDLDSDLDLNGVVDVFDLLRYQTSWFRKS